MPDRRPTDLRAPESIGAGPPATATPPASTIAAGGSGHGPASFGLAGFRASLAEASRRTLGMLTAAMAAVIAATIAGGLYTTERYAALAYTFMTEPTQNVLDMTVADLVWNDYRRTVTGLAAEIAGELRQPFAAGDRGAHSTSLADAGRRGTVSSGAIVRRGAQVLDLEFAALASSGSGASGFGAGGLAAPMAAFLQGRRGNDRLVTEPVGWLDDSRPVMSIVAPLGCLLLGLGLTAVAIGLVAQSLRRAETARSAAEASSAADRSAARHRLADDLERECRSFAETMAATASRFEEHSKGVAEPARSASGESRAALGDGARVAERTTAVAAAAEGLTVSIEAARAGEQGRGFAVVATEGSRTSPDRAPRLPRRQQAKWRRWARRSRPPTTPWGAIGSMVRRVAGIVETVGEAVDSQEPATVKIENDIRAVVEAAEATARRLGAMALGADTAGEATAELMAGVGQLGHEPRALLARVDAMLDRRRAA